jgi:uncharacterized membrane protein YphA (DoxX/SURF4 family)
MTSNDTYNDTHAVGQPEESDRQAQATAPWSTLHKVAFRFAFCYFAQYILFAAPYFVGTLVARKFLWNGTPVFELPWLKIVPWVAAHVLRHPISGTGATADSPYQYVKLFSFALIAAVVTLVWSILDRKRAGYSKLDQWLRLSLRLVLACAMFVYGGIKVMPSQMPPPSLARLIQPFGDLTPYHLLWNFMGSSTFYEVLCGLVEMTCGVLLLIPGMTMLGALLSLAAVGNVLILNISYDVAVKIIPMNLAVFSFYLLLPYLPRIMNLFVFNRVVQPERKAALFQRRGLNNLTWGLQWALGLYFALTTLLASATHANGHRENPQANPLYGIWDVNEFAADGQVHPPLLTDDLRWQRVVVDSESRLLGKMTLAFQGMNSQWSPYLVTLDEKNGSISLRSPKPNDIMESTEWLTSPSAAVSSPDRPANISLNYSRPQPNELILQGLVNGHQLRVTLKKEDRQFLLETHKSRWVHQDFTD